MYYQSRSTRVRVLDEAVSQLMVSMSRMRGAKFRMPRTALCADERRIWGRASLES